ncbi:Bacteroides conjugative transposon TraJ protein [Mucilaginibacter gossypiicola]|uniref:Bacteroides conjugative transposon TraJ protein n=1 Tax=Mucilaginibacter gossypiicola TaxID=551995 RepID=A0A1H8HNK9_9SPHI|nr:conjugative transposon protein TraJ [Mucilaginibacter gossypiicola]SEN57527.1 Bacteroides conjugative transposon TraJ protein [Mucilaginibacter gossypiicola]
MKTCRRAAILAAVGMLFPFLSHAQSRGGVADTIGSLQPILDNLYNEMMPMCSQLIGVGSGIAGFAATWYIASRLWRHLANAEPIDFYPLFRPFVLGFCIVIFPSVIAMINGVMQPTVTGTASMVNNTNEAVATLLKQKEDVVKNSDAWKMYVGDDNKGDEDRWYKYTHDGADPDDQGMFESIGNDMRFAMEKVSYNFRNSVKQWMSEVLQVLFQAAALCINTLRTFQLIVLAILGPMVFGIAVFDGFQHTLTAWIARYINIFLWLPVCNIFGAIIGKIQEQMLRLDLSQIQNSGDTFFSAADTGYLIFMLIGIVGYFTVPSVANSIVHAGGLGAMLQKVTNISASTTSGVISRAGQGATAISSVPSAYQSGLAGQDGAGLSGAAGRSIGGSAAYMKDKLSGKSES